MRFGEVRPRDVRRGNVAAARTIVMQQKTQHPVQFEMTEQTRDALTAWIRSVGIRSEGTYFRAGSIHRHIFPPGGMRVS